MRAAILRWIRPAIAIVLLSAAGCTTETAEGNRFTYTFALWVPISVLLLGLVVSFAGWFVRLWKTFWGWVMIVMGPLLVVVVVPNLFIDSAVVDPEHFTLRTGLWFAPRHHNIRFADLTRLEMTSETRRGRRGTSTSYYFVCHFKNGGNEKVPLGDLMRNGPSDRILQMVHGRGIPVIDLRE
jgi:hypothetical protein